MMIDRAANHRSTSYTNNGSTPKAENTYPLAEAPGSSNEASRRPYHHLPALGLLSRAIRLLKAIFRGGIPTCFEGWYPSIAGLVVWRIGQEYLPFMKA